MKVFSVSMMLSVQLTYILLFLSLCASVFSFPSTPLNERSQEISWQAWLLIDDQNQNRQNIDGVTPRRRITPKSVFVAPTFSPENLPPCAEGYSSDDMGRCIKIIKIDENRHLDFLVSKLNEKFGVIDYEEEAEEIDTSKSEPFQLNIPLSLDDDDYSNDTPEEEANFAIIVTPTTKNSAENIDNGAKVDKRNDRNENQTEMIDMYEQELKKLLEVSTTTKNYEETTRIFNVEQSDGVSEELNRYTTLHDIKGDEVEPTTFHTAEDMETTTLVTTTGDAVEEKTTLRMELDEQQDDSLTEVSQDVESTTFTEPTSTLEGTTIIPVRKVTNFKPSKLTELPSAVSKITTATPKITTYHPKVITYHPHFDMSLLDNFKTKNLIKFPEAEPAIPRTHPDGSYVRFPDVDSSYQQESQAHQTRDVDDHSGNFFNEIVTSAPSHQVKEIVLPPKGAYKGYFSNFFPSEARNLDSAPSAQFHPKFFPAKEVPEKLQESQPALVNRHNFPYQVGATTEKSSSKKGKERHGSMFLIPPTWSGNSHQKPLVLRFSRKHFNVDTNKFKNNEFYRSVPMDDLSFLFGYKHGETSHR